MVADELLLLLRKFEGKRLLSAKIFSLLRPLLLRQNGALSVELEIAMLIILCSVLELADNGRIWLHFEGIELIAAELRLHLLLFVQILAMHLVVVHEELLDPRRQVPLHPMMLVRVQTEGAKIARKGDVVSVGAEVDVDLVVHRELIDRVDAILDDFLHDAHPFCVEDEDEAAIEAGEEDRLISRMTPHDARIIENILVILAVFGQVIRQNLHGVGVEYLNFDVRRILLFIFIL